MNNILGENIARLRKERGMTQEDLAGELNVSYQAVSKWETGVSSPDISNIKQLAQFFGVSIDCLFGLELSSGRPEEAFLQFEEEEMAAQDPEPEKSDEANEEREEDFFLPWENDNTLRAVLFRGRELVSAEEIGKMRSARGVTLEYRGEAADVFSFFDVKCGAVSGNVEAGGDVTCGSVGMSVNCGGDVDCKDVGGDVRAGGDVDCGVVAGNVSAGGDVDCGAVNGNVSAEGDIDCGMVMGSVFRK